MYKRQEENTGQTSELPIKTLTQKVIDENPYMAASDSNIHHDCYNTDSTDEVLPVGIYSEINVSYEKTNANASPAIFFDSYGHAVVPLLGGLAIRDINAEETQTLGYFSPKQHDNGDYLIQSSYSFVDESNRLVCPTNNNPVSYTHLDVYKRQAQESATAQRLGDVKKISEVVTVPLPRKFASSHSGLYFLSSIFTRPLISVSSACLLYTSDKYPVIAVVGGGGKTSLIYRLNEELQALGKKVIISTTTHMAYDPMLPLVKSTDLEQVSEMLKEHGFADVYKRQEKKHKGPTISSKKNRKLVF